MSLWHHLKWETCSQERNGVRTDNINFNYSILLLYDELMETKNLVYFKVKLWFSFCGRMQQPGRVIYRQNGIIASPLDLHVESRFQEIDSFYTEKSTMSQKTSSRPIYDRYGVSNYSITSKGVSQSSQWTSSKHCYVFPIMALNLD